MRIEMEKLLVRQVVQVRDVVGEAQCCELVHDGFSHALDVHGVL